MVRWNAGKTKLIEKLSKLSCCFVLLFYLPSVPLYAQSENVYHPIHTFPEYAKLRCDDQNSTDCYYEFLNKLKSNYQFNEEGSYPALSLKNYSVDGYSNIRVNNEKTKYVFVSIHGLWGSTRQLQSFVQSGRPEIGDEKFNFIELSLPGHNNRSEKLSKGNPAVNTSTSSLPRAKFEHWLVAVVNSLKVAKLMGEKTIVYGQSTGGLLAVYAAVHFPELVDTLVLIEPALKVRPIMDLGSCLAENAWAQPMIRGIGNLMGVEPSKQVSIGMGCEVQKLANILLNGDPENEELYRSLAKKIMVPVFLYNNKADKIVDHEKNQVFFDALNVPKAMDNVFPGISHGDTFYLNFNQELSSLIFLYKVLGEKIFEQRLVKELLYKAFTHEREQNFCFYRYIVKELLGDCEKRVRKLKQQYNMIVEAYCLVDVISMSCEEFGTFYGKLVEELSADYYRLRQHRALRRQKYSPEWLRGRFKYGSKRSKFGDQLSDLRKLIIENYLL